MTGEIPQEQVPTDAGQAALLPVTFTAVRREVTVARPDGGPLTDGDFTRLYALVRSGVL
ncbi:hypothetical protein [Streptomyces sp. NPDC002746]